MPRKIDRWKQHVADFRRAHPKLTYKQALVEASKTYDKESAPKNKGTAAKRIEKINRDLISGSIIVDDISQGDHDEYMAHYWRDNVKTYQDLVDRNVKFLKGEIFMTPYHGGPIVDNHEVVLSELIEINKAGFLSVDGQPHDSSGLQSYIFGFFPKSRAKNLVQFMSSRSDVYTYVVSLAPFKVLFNNHKNNGWSMYFYEIEKKTRVGKRWVTKTVWEDSPDPMPKSENYTDVTAFDKYSGKRVGDILRKNCVYVIMTGRFLQGTSVEPALLDFIAWEKGRV